MRKGPLRALFLACYRRLSQQRRDVLGNGRESRCDAQHGDGALQQEHAAPVWITSRITLTRFHK
jgi:hypothetical protein